MLITKSMSCRKPGVVSSVSNIGSVAAYSMGALVERGIAVMFEFATASDRFSAIDSVTASLDDDGGGCGDCFGVEITVTLL